MCKIQVRISEGKKERNGMGRSRTFQESERREGSMEGRQEGRGRTVQESPAGAVIDCSNFTQTVGVECLWVSA